jgi:caffeoyl-CoA O-methyltransferase
MCHDLVMTDITDPAIDAYSAAHSEAEPALLTELARATYGFSDMPQMMVGRLEGRFLKLLVAAIGARRVLEVGTFTGYSALSMAEALPPDGEIVTHDINERHVEFARGYIARSSYADRIRIVVGPAVETLKQLEPAFDFAFIDADKPNNRTYYEEALRVLRPGGLICVDNVLRGGAVLDDGNRAEAVAATRDFNDFVAADRRVEGVLLPIRDGVMLVRKV